LLEGLRVEPAPAFGGRLRPITGFRTRATAELLAYLAYHPGPQSREVLATLLDPDGDPGKSRHRLRTELASLRKRLEPAGIVPPGAVLLGLGDRRTTGLRPEAIESDLSEFQAAVREAKKQAPSALVRAERLIRATELCPDWNAFLPGHCWDWIRSERDTQEEEQQRRLLAIELFLRGDGKVGRPSVDPPPSRRPEPAPPRPPEHNEGDSGGDKGDDSGAAADGAISPRRVVAPADTSRRGAAVDASAGSPPILLPPTRFIGRDAQIRHIRGEMAGGRAGLVTLTGTGGVGKTRLAQEAAREQQQQGGRAVWFVPLADVRTRGLILERIAQALLLPPAPTLTPLERVATALRQARAPLLVLDNFEHLLEGEGAAVVGALLEGAPALTCLVTSREALGLPQERVLVLEPLPVPDAPAQEGRRRGALLSPEGLASLLAIPSVALFVDRAQTARADFALTRGNAATLARLCRHLDGLPLAIELASALAHDYPPHQMLAALREKRFGVLVNRRADPASRHRSLEAALSWSYELLSEELRTFFARLSVFRGGWPAAGARAICAEDFPRNHSVPDRARVGDYHELLARRSLIRYGEVSPGGLPEMRFSLLESLREFAAERRAPGDEHQALLSRRHADWFLRLAEEASAHVPGPREGEWLDRLAVEQANLGAALDWYQSPDGDPQKALRLAAALWPFWRIRGHLVEGLRRLEAVLARPDTKKYPPERAAALHAAGVLAYRLNRLPEAKAYAQECLALCQERGDRIGEARALWSLGNVALWSGDYDQAVRHHQQSGALARALGREPEQASALHGLAHALVEQPTPDFPAHRWLLAQARPFYEASLALSRRGQDNASTAATLNNLMRLCTTQADYHAAHACGSECLDLRRQLHDTPGIAQTLMSFARLAREEKQDRRAAVLYGAGTSLHERLALPVPPFAREAIEEAIAALKQALGEPVFEAAWQEGAALGFEEAIRFAQTRFAQTRF